MKKKDSREELERKAKQLRNTRIWLGACAALVIVAFGFWRFANSKTKEAEIAKAAAVKALTGFQIEQRTKNSLRIQELDARANTILEAGGRPLEILKSMDTIYNENRYDTIPEMKWINKSIDSIKNISDSIGNVYGLTEKKYIKRP